MSTEAIDKTAEDLREENMDLKQEVKDLHRELDAAEREASAAIDELESERDELQKKIDRYESGDNIRRLIDARNAVLSGRADDAVYDIERVLSEMDSAWRCR